MRREKALSVAWLGRCRDCHAQVPFLTNGRCRDCHIADEVATAVCDTCGLALPMLGATGPERCQGHTFQGPVAA